MDPIVARKNWRTLEPFHGFVYFAAEPAEAYARLGIEGRSGYFASRSAPMGAVPAEVVIATFYNFCPALVHEAMDGVWELTSSEALVEARFEGVDQALRRVIVDDIGGPAMAEAADLARTAAEACDTAGRPLAAGHASVERPGATHLALWHDVSVVREFRGDGHISALVSHGIGPCEALVMHAASGDVPKAALQTTRAWPDADWDAAVARLADRGIVDAAGSFTPEGAALRQEIEDRTDQLAIAPWEALGDEGSDRLRQLVRPWSKAIMDSGIFGLR